MKQFFLPPSTKKVLYKCCKNNCRLVLATGVFDLLHAEHIKFLKQAKQAGDCLLVGVETDSRVEKLKGEDRPVQSEKQRMQKLKSANLADAVFLLPKKFDKKENHLALIKLLEPQILAVSERSPNLKQKRNIMQQVGGRVAIVHPHNPKVSTTKIITKHSDK